MKKKSICRFFTLLLLLALTACAGMGSGGSLPQIVSSYSGVDWQSYGQYKAGLHAHSTNSDGTSPFNRVVELHYERGFDLLAMTDHNQVTRDWISVSNGLTPERFEEISRGEGRGGRPMVMIPDTNEQTIQPIFGQVNDHVNSFFTNWTYTRRNNLRDIFEAVEEHGGLSFVNHPGMYTGGWLGREAGGESRGADQSNSEHWVSRYTDMFMEFPALGMEIVNSNDGVTASDRILWDNVLARTIPQGRYVWGFAIDDSHRDREIDVAFSMFVMPENNLDNFREAMVSGAFYAVSRRARRELGQSFLGTAPVPRILEIAVNEQNGSISIIAENYDRIEWIADGRVIARGSTIRLGSQRRNIGSYVRANIIGPGGIAFTQPFGVFW